MTEEERKKRIAELRAELKELQATPRSDWHAGFEALLRIDTHKYGNRIRIKSQEVLGEEPPRADYLVLIENETVEFDKEIFGIFRKFNVIEYKYPHDSLNERVIRKIIGYANFFAGVAEHEGDVDAGQVTISIFRAAKPVELFKKIDGTGNLEVDDTPGIYRVTGLTDMPFQIVITDELVGSEYAAYRALTDSASGTDIEQIIADDEKESDYAIREHYRILLKLVVEKNMDVIDEIRRKGTMSKNAEDAIMEIFKDRIDERVSAKEQETKTVDIKNLMSNLKLTLDQAMDALGIPQGDRGTYAGLVQEKN